MSASRARGTTSAAGVERAFEAPAFEPRHPAFARRTRGDFARQGFMRTLGVRMLEIAPGLGRAL